MVIFFEFAGEPSLAASKGADNRLPPTANGKPKRLDFPTDEIAENTLEMIRKKLQKSLPEFKPRVAMRFLTSRTGVGWQGAVLLVQSEGELRPPKSVRNFAKKAIEAAVDSAIRANEDLRKTWSALEDAQLPVTTVTGEEDIAKDDEESGIIESEWYEPIATARNRSPLPSFATAIAALLLSAISFAGFAYLVSRMPSP